MNRTSANFQIILIETWTYLHLCWEAIRSLLSDGTKWNHKLCTHFVQELQLIPIFPSPNTFVVPFTIIEYLQWCGNTGWVTLVFLRYKLLEESDIFLQSGNHQWNACLNPIASLPLLVWVHYDPSLYMRVKAGWEKGVPLRLMSYDLVTTIHKHDDVQRKHFPKINMQQISSFCFIV